MARQIMPAAPCYVIPLNCSTLESKRGLKMDHLIKAKKLLQKFRLGIKRRMPWAMSPLLFPDKE